MSWNSGQLRSSLTRSGPTATGATPGLPLLAEEPPGVCLLAGKRPRLGRGPLRAGRHGRDFAPGAEMSASDGRFIAIWASDETRPALAPALDPRGGCARRGPRARAVQAVRSRHAPHPRPHTSDREASPAEADRPRDARHPRRQPNRCSFAPEGPRGSLAGAAEAFRTGAAWRLVAWDGVEPPTRGFSGRSHPAERLPSAAVGPRPRRRERKPLSVTSARMRMSLNLCAAEVVPVSESNGAWVNPASLNNPPIGGAP